MQEKHTSPLQYSVHRSIAVIIAVFLAMLTATTNAASTGSLAPVLSLLLFDNTIVQINSDSGTCVVFDDGRAKCWGDTISADENGIPNLRNIKTLALGDEHSCAVLKTGRVACWGDNDDGQLGNGNNSSSNNSVVEVSNLNNAVSVSVGQSHSCALLATGAVQCWGSNYYGQLGNANNSDSNIPVSVNSIANAVQLDAAGNNACATLATGDIKCWGANGLFGQLGNNSTNASNVPVTVLQISNAIEVKLAGEHSCAVLSTGAMKCWGRGSSGQLGDGNSNTALSPVNVAQVNTAVESSVFAYHSCARLSSGEVKCWGNNSSGQLGDGSLTGTATPVFVSGLNKARSIVTGDALSCAVIADRAVQCWGRNDNNGLGNGSFSRYPLPTEMSLVENNALISLGRDHGCLADSDHVACWGANTYGQLGISAGAPVFSSQPLPAQTISGSLKALSSGYHFTCSVTADGKAWCWGYNNKGQLGSGDTVNTANPVQVPLSGTATDISTGDGFACAVLTSKKIQCWGNNFYGNLGNGTTTNSLTPVDVSGITNAKTIVLGGTFACALLDDKSVSCWGRNTAGELGNGTLTNASTPGPISGANNNANALAAGADHACKITTSGSIDCWGFNNRGQLGIGNTTNQNTPVPVLNISGAKKLDLGEDHSCTILGDSSMKCWGDNFDRQLGAGSTAFREKTPVNVILPDTAFSALGLGRTTSCARAGTKLYCWGNNQSGKAGQFYQSHSTLPIDVMLDP